MEKLVTRRRVIGKNMSDILPYVLHGMFNREISLWDTMLTIFDGINSLFGCHKDLDGYQRTQLSQNDKMFSCANKNQC